MKNLKLFAVLALIAAVISFESCTKTSPNLTKSSTIELKAVSSSKSLKSTQGLSIISATINIANLQIEENSGNDGENVTGGNQDEGTDNNETNSESDNGDILLPGPFALDIANGSASIGQVDVYPGTFKKVDFDFQKSNTLNGNSISITGEYTTTDGTIVPFIINSTFAKQVQMPLSGTGVIVSANSSVAINIIFDVNAWISNLDFAMATISNGIIIINTSDNATLLSAFEANLTTYAEQEE